MFRTGHFNYASLEQVQKKDLHEKYDTLIDSHDDLEKANAELQQRFTELDNLMARTFLRDVMRETTL
jgi:chromosome segregation ATPase